MNHRLHQNPNTNYDILSDILTELKVKHTIFKRFKNDIKNTWKTITDTLGRHKKNKKCPIRWYTKMIQ